ncbi:hypothetical protein AAFF_G00244400 [Aldrovandia affinis]|uniref:Uncharacterized protein n=1 Tax=Aldrovandia affinis TaxID=143900 RepID=A0AAD7RDU4_9TELE|nr:hypothetical protein AAFF_G00244400 [Aldrovandia affinis]
MRTSQRDWAASGPMAELPSSICGTVGSATQAPPLSRNHLRFAGLNPQPNSVILSQGDHDGGTCQNATWPTLVSSREPGAALWSGGVESEPPSAPPSFTEHGVNEVKQTHDFPIGRRPGVCDAGVYSGITLDGTHMAGGG